MTVLGFWLTVVAFLASAVSAILFVRTAGGHGREGSARRWLFVSLGAILLSSFLLLALLFRHDYANGYVFSYSSTSLPIHFLISSFYAGQEGSFLFWALCSTIIAVILSRHTRRTHSEAPVMGVFMTLQAALILLVLVKSPFRSLWEMFPGMAGGDLPGDGRGLNPLLQNFWMVVHPPVLFIGFALMAVPFSFALAGLWKKEFGWLSYGGFPWVLSATFVLGLGIMLGAYWAYGVLGWGGYWGWDPVENSSLVPWLTGVALIHTIIAHRRSGAFLRANMLLAIASFVLVVYSTFLTRSGILGDASVHSFTDPGTIVYSVLLGFLSLITVGGFGMLLLRRRELRDASRETCSMSREMMLGLGALALVLAAVVVLFGTSLPIFSKRTVEPSFYDITTLPLAVVIALLIGYSLYTQWGIGETRAMLRRSLMASGFALLVTAVLAWFVLRDTAMQAFVFASIFALAVNVAMAWKTRTVGVMALGGKFAHLGLALFFLGVVSTGRYSSERDLALELQKPTEALGYTFTYLGNRPTVDGKYAFDVAVEKEGRRTVLAPVMFQAGEQGIMRNPDISTSVLRDIYVSPVSLEEASHNHAESYTLQKGERVSMGTVTAQFLRFDMGNHAGKAGMMADGAMTIGSVLELSDGRESETIIPSAVYQSGGSPEYRPSSSRLMNATVRLVAMNVGMGQAPSTVTVEVEHAQHRDAKGETLVVKASVKPLVNFLWVGTLVMFAGFLFATVRRAKE
jgi:cytochrome c-type biogenesis protein CcmF